MSEAKPAAVVAVQPHVALPGSEHGGEDGDEDRPAEGMPGTDSDAPAENGREPVKTRGPKRESGERRVEKAERDDPVDQALGEGESGEFVGVVHAINIAITAAELVARSGHSTLQTPGANSPQRPEPICARSVGVKSSPSP